MRIYGFDILRGLCALAVAICHICIWSDYASPHIVGTVSVTLFFVLSGASMTIAYAERLKNGLPYPNFIAQRLFRLAPLFWLLLLLSGRAFGTHFYQTLFNASFLFSFGLSSNPTILVGSWSLGIEFLFYLIFPLMLMALSKKTAPFIFCFALVMQQYYASVADPAARDSLMFFIAYFFGGCMIGQSFLQPFRMRGCIAWPLFTAALLNLLYICTHADGITFLGAAGAFLTMHCLALVYLAGHLNVAKKVLWVAVVMGDMSYGLYLLHPYVYHALRIIPGLQENRPLWPFMVIAVSIATALMSEKYYEKPIRNFGYRFLKIRQYK